MNLLQVASHVGAWIETRFKGQHGNIHFVASHVGAWIETSKMFIMNSVKWVASHVGAWIETPPENDVTYYYRGRIPCGCVD